jgi:hypothetical protein
VNVPEIAWEVSELNAFPKGQAAEVFHSVVSDGEAMWSLMAIDDRIDKSRARP